jgi:hypothetical protein
MNFTVGSFELEEFQALVVVPLWVIYIRFITPIAMMKTETYSQPVDPKCFAARAIPPVVAEIWTII